MNGDERFRLLGVYVSPPVYEALADRAYEEAGVVDFEAYFDSDASTVPVDDPGAQATDEMLTAIVSTFASLYDDADFEAAERVDPDGFVLVSMAADPDVVANARELFQAAARIRDADLRTVHTAVLAAYLSTTPIAE